MLTILYVFVSVMAVKRLYQVGEKVIRAKAKRVTSKDQKKLPQLITDLIDTMRATNLIGIAAPQIGVSLQVFVTEIRRTKTRKDARDLDQLRVFINPRVVSLSGRPTVLTEGCGSLGAENSRLFGPVRRPSLVVMEALSEHLEPFTVKASGLLAKCLQHEYDHLQGVVVLDKFTDTKKCWVKID
jgi:peptide deformylase